MTKALNAAGIVMVMLIILAAISGALRLSWIVDDCELANRGTRCRLMISAEPQR